MHALFMSIFDFETVFRAFQLSVDLYASLYVFGLFVASSDVLPCFSHYIKKPVLLMDRALWGHGFCVIDSKHINEICMAAGSGEWKWDFPQARILPDGLMGGSARRKPKDSA